MMHVIVCVVSWIWMSKKMEEANKVICGCDCLGKYTRNTKLSFIFSLFYIFTHHVIIKWRCIEEKMKIHSLDLLILIGQVSIVNFDLELINSSQICPPSVFRKAVQKIQAGRFVQIHAMLNMLSHQMMGLTNSPCNKEEQENNPIDLKERIKATQMFDGREFQKFQNESLKMYQFWRRYYTSTARPVSPQFPMLPSPNIYVCEFD